MVLILQSFILSIGVAARMIVPLILISIASIVVWLVLGMLTLGLSSYVSTSITTAFITLYGIRMALELKGDKSFVDLRVLATYSIAFGIVLEVLERIAVFAAGWLAVFATQWQLGSPISVQNLQTAKDSIQFAFEWNLLSFYAVFAFVAFVVIQTVFAVPMAAAARTAGKGATSTTFLDGFGSNFIPLFLIFLVSFFLQFFFKLYGMILFVFGAMLVNLTLLINQIADYVGSDETVGLDLLSGFDPMIILYSMLALFALIWLQSLIWSAAALALLKRDGVAGHRRTVTRQDDARPSIDLRALRKARENSTS